MTNQKMFKIQRKLIIKDKKLTNEEKFEKLRNTYRDYFKSQIKGEVDLAMSELYVRSESALPLSKEDYKKYYIDCYNYEMKSRLLVKSVEFMHDVEKLQRKGLKENEMNAFLVSQMNTLKSRLENYDGNLQNHPEIVYNAVQIANYITDDVVQDELMLK